MDAPLIEYNIWVVSTEEKPLPMSMDRKVTVLAPAVNTYTELKAAFLNELSMPADTDIQLWKLSSPPACTDTALSFSVDSDADHIYCPVESDSVDSLLDGGNYAIKINSDYEDYPIEQHSPDTRPSSEASSVSTTSSIFVSEFKNLVAASASPPASASASPLFSSASTFEASTHEPNNDFDLWMSESTTTHVKGVCGLVNMGNTCFMSAAIQCLSHVPELTQWFLSGHHKKDLNRDNPLGMGGEVAEAYGEWIETGWSGKASSFTPRHLKSTIGRFNPTFTGYQQHDSQELLAFLLDGLHEDLNRISKKPYVELPDFGGMTDQEIAQCSWDYHKARNDSVIVDLFQGQFKSRLTCNVCQKVSVTFDPYMYLSLPVPVDNRRKMKVVYVPYLNARPCRIVLTLKKESSIKLLKDMVAKRMKIENSATLLAVEIYNNKLYKILPDYEPTAGIADSDIIYIYQLPEPLTPPHQSRKRSYGYQHHSSSSSSDDNDSDSDDIKEKEDNSLIIFPVYCVSTSKELTGKRDRNISQFGGPGILAVKKKEAKTPEDIYRLISAYLANYVKKDIPAIDSLSYAEESKPEPAQKEPVEESFNEESMDIDCSSAEDIPEVETAETGETGETGENEENEENEERLQQGLFMMKIFSQGGYERHGRGDFIPTSVSSWNHAYLVDLKKRSEEEASAREEYEAKQRLDTSATEIGTLTGKEETTVERIEAETETEVEEEEDDIVRDASLEWEENTSPKISTPIRHTQFSHKTRSKKTSAALSESVIRQGEGIMIAWNTRIAQDYFGTSTESHMAYDMSEDTVSSSAWEIDEELDDSEPETETKKKELSLSGCMDEFTKEEELTEEDSWYCPRCKEHQPALKKFDLWHLPEIMVIHLKRFSQTRVWRDKIDDYIDFPTQGLDLTARVLGKEEGQTVALEDRFIYDLFAVDNHFGGMGGGHYTAHAYNTEDSQWYYFDDSRVTKADVEEAKTSAAYLLFYKRRREPSSSSNTTEAGMEKVVLEEPSITENTTPNEQPTSFVKESLVSTTEPHEQQQAITHNPIA
ncbi:hypothetical protein BDF14DRAFT_1973336 [Spinellus fusiger]|nr:hypothetical protein BDF14DRAFT_1973336 [Spinellus fusiger]